MEKFRCKIIYFRTFSVYENIFTTKIKYMYQTSGSCFGDSPDISTRHFTSIRPLFVECQFLSRDFPWSSCGWAAITTMLVFVAREVWSPLREETQTVTPVGVSTPGKRDYWLFLQYACIYKSTRKLIVCVQ